MTSPTELRVPRDAPQAPREKLRLLGPQALTDRELLAVLLGTGSRTRSVFEVVEHLLPEGAGLARLADRGLAELAGETGVGWAGASRIAALLEAGRRLARPGLPLGRPIERPAEVWRLLRGEAQVHREERVWLLALDIRHRLLSERCLSIGSLTASIVHPREVYRTALSCGAAAIVLAHNHPSGDPRPSVEDHHVTRRMEEAGRLLGIEFLDHVILGSRAYFSFQEEGWIPGCGAADEGDEVAQDSRARGREFERWQRPCSWGSSSALPASLLTILVERRRIVDRSST